MKNSDMSADQNLRGLCLILPSTLSMLATAYMIKLSPRLYKKTSYKILFYIAISNFLSAAGSSVGLPPSGSFACTWEAVVTNIFSLSSIFWNVLLVYLLLTICTSNNKAYRINIYSHILCWGFPILVTFLPLTQLEFGSTRGDWCFIIPKKDSPEWALTFWIWMSFYTWVWLSEFTMLAIMAYVHWSIYLSAKKTVKVMIDDIFIRIKWYPVVIFVCWGIQTFLDSLLGNVHVHPHLIMTFDVITCLQGLFTTVVFMATTQSIRSDLKKISPLNNRVNEAFDSLGEFSIKHSVSPDKLGPMSPDPEEHDDISQEFEKPLENEVDDDAMVMKLRHF